MIISHKYKFIFIHIPKCAGTSITRTLAPLLGEHDLVIGCTPEGERLHQENMKKGGLTKHSTAQQIMQHVGPEIWNSYFKFSFVRNPWDLMVSRYHWCLKTTWEDEKNTIKRIRELEDFEDYLLSPLSNRKSCIEYISDIDGNINLDYIGKFERLSNDFYEVCQRIGLPNIEIGIHNNTEHLHYTKYYNPLTRDLIKDRYARYIQYFDYVF